MIPKIIHYCWFGRNEKPESVLRCIKSWKLHLPDFKIIEWNEENFDINSHQFVKEAYLAKKYGFIVDVLRMYALKEMGGIYLDTDVEFIRSLPEPFLNDKAFGCFEIDYKINVGLIASEKNGVFVNAIYNLYKDRHFIIDGKINEDFTGPVGVTKYLNNIGILLDGNYIKNEFLTIYPLEYFSPKDYKTGLCNITDNTVCIHLYDASWVDAKQLLKNQYKERLIKSIKECITFMTPRAILGLVYRTLNIKSALQILYLYLK